MAITRQALRIISIALLSGLVGAPALAEVKIPVPAIDQSAVAKRGFFYVGGHYVGEAGKQIMQGQIYVEVLVPKRQRRPYPLVLIHGAAQTATNWMGTPDGRKGWAEYFVERGYVVYMIDQPMRARSAYHPGDGATRMFTAENEEFQFTAIETNGTWPGREKHTQWPGEGPNKGKAGDPIFDAFYATQVETVISAEETEQRNQDAGAALLDKIGPAIVLTHSQSGAFGWPVADARPDLVKAIVAVEPNGPPFYQVEFKGAPDWFKPGTLALPYGITAVPLTYSPPIKDASELKMVQQEKADGPDLVRCYAQAEPARQLPNLQKMPILVVTSEASYHAPYDHCTVNYLRQAGVKPTYIRLADIGIKGNSHVMMLEKNNKDIAAVLAKWLDEAVPAKM